MAIIYYLIQLPPFLLFILIISFGGIVAGLSTYLFRKYIKLKILRAHNEVTGFLFLAIASFYAFLLSFVVFMVWGQLNETQGNVSKEGSSAMGLYRDIKYYPDTIESKQLMIVYLDFVYNVIDEEFPNMGRLKPSRKTTESFNRVFYKIEHLNPKNQFQIQLVAEMFIIATSCGSHEKKPDDAFDRVKQVRMLSNDSNFTSDEILEESMKTEKVKKIVILDEWTKYKNEMERKIRQNENKIKEIKGHPEANTGSLRKVDRLEKANNELKTKMDEYHEKVKVKWEMFKTSMNHNVNVIELELNALKTGHKK